MNTTFLIVLLVVLLIILLLLLVTYILMQSGNKRVKKSTSLAEKKVDRKKAVRSFEELAGVLKNRQSSSSDLGDALDEIISHYGHIHAKLGIRPHPDFDRYSELVFAICRHQNTTKDLIVSFDRGLSRLNPQYRLEIDEEVKKGLNSRGM